MKTLPTGQAIYFADAVHPEHQTKPAFGWARKGSNRAEKTTAGRGRANIHGALCLENFDAPFVEFVTVEGNSAVHLLKKFQATNPTKSIIHVIWGTAAHHRCDAVKNWLAQPGCRIHLIQLLANCPHLSSIERLWRSHACSRHAQSLLSNAKDVRRRDLAVLTSNRP
jgi:hypothetical protein